MTNGEKYLKVSINEFFKAILKSKIDISGLYSLEKWLLEEAKPTLTEAERVILENIDLENFKAIGRKDDYLYLRYANECYEYGETDIKTLTFWYMYHNLFKFIGERRRI